MLYNKKLFPEKNYKRGISQDLRFAAARNYNNEYYF